MIFSFISLCISFYNFPINYLVAIATPILFINIENVLKSRLRIKWLIFCGENSLLIMVLHYNIVLPVVLQVVNGIELFSNTEEMILRWFVFALDLIGTALLLKVVINNELLSFCFGKGKLFSEFKKKMLIHN